MDLGIFIFAALIMREKRERIAANDSGAPCGACTVYSLLEIFYVLKNVKTSMKVATFLQVLKLIFS